MNLKNFIGVDVPSQRDKDPKEFELYKEMKDRIESLEEDETGILFLPYPIMLSSPEYIFNLCSDQFDWLFSKMGVKKKVYLIGLYIYMTRLFANNWEDMKEQSIWKIDILAI